MRVLLLGGTGLLGASLSPYLEPLHEVLVHGQSAGSSWCADLGDLQAARTLFARAQADACVLLVAATDVDRCEREPKWAHRLNALSALNAAIAARESACDRLVMISTDQVYNNPAGSSVEDIAPLNAYSWSKLAGEAAMLSAGACVLRTNFFGKSRHSVRKSFSDWIVTRLRQGLETPVFEDVYFNPLSMGGLCATIAAGIKSERRGVFNLGSRGALSKAQFAHQLARSIGLDTNLLRVTSVAQAGLHAPRPTHMVMDISATENAFDFQLPSFEREIERAAQEYLHEQTGTRIFH